MNSPRSFLVNALIEWILDNHCTPHIVIDTTVPHVSVPDQYVQDDRIVLNVKPSAVRNFVLDTTLLSFTTRFAGVSYEIVAPPGAVVGVFAKETSEGSTFDREVDTSWTAPVNVDSGVGSKPSASHLKVVK